MSRPYSLTEDEFYALQRAQESINLLSILFGEVRGSSTYTPAMIASFLERVGEDISLVIQSAVKALPPPRLKQTG
ncbi:hypothetical protein CYD26_06715 [Pseudomonas sp. FFUP_PS_473]|uniref:hypothetical protein n=1 Tax=Pseudomonas sp. FFUP_PS_473 TaxID=2060418 RepID=UPI000C7E495D|nr:hypothetical protein [Pseudomonas sp. FFUP_PS_473]PLP94834.1 hypothetical protein CYD26_06715 [Pseudomonas sp. FFUP_PS_473]